MAYNLTDVKIANMALALVGNSSTVTSVTSTTDGIDRIISTHYEDVRRLALVKHDWNFARVRRRLGLAEVPAPVDLESSDYLAAVDTDPVEVAGTWAYRYRYPVDVVKVRYVENPAGRRLPAVPYETRQTSVLDTANSKKISNITKASPGVVTTATAHGLSAGDVVFITGIKEAADAEDLTDMEEIDGRLLSVGTATGTATFSLQGVLTGSAFDTSSFTTYNTTEDNGRVMKLLQGERCILVDNADAVAICTKYETDPTLYSPQFVDAFVQLLAERIVMPLTGDRLLATAITQRRVRDEYVSRGIDAQEGHGHEPRDADWIAGR